jgi:hypothetical protein
MPPPYDVGESSKAGVRPAIRLRVQSSGGQGRQGFMRLEQKDGGGASL